MAIKVRGLDKNNDWQFGNGQANYKLEDNAILQNVQTRLKSLKNDFFLDSEANIDWFGILGQPNNKDIVISEIYRVTLATDGVIGINNINVITLNRRNATIEVNFVTINNTEILTSLGIIDG